MKKISFLSILFALGIHSSFAASSSLDDVLIKKQKNVLRLDNHHKNQAQNIIDFLTKNQAPEEEKSIISQQFDLSDKEGRFESASANARVFWLALQTAMALTPVEKRKRDCTSDANALDIALLLQEDKASSVPMWLHSFDLLLEKYPIQESVLTDGFEKFFSNFLKMSLYYDFKYCLGSGKFTEGDFLDHLGNRTYLLGIDTESKFGVHGGIFKTTIEILMHDTIHLYPQVLYKGGDYTSFETYLSREFSDFSPYVTKWNVCAKALSDLIKKVETLDETEKRKLEIFGFLIFHEVQTFIPGSFKKNFINLPVADCLKLVACNWKKDRLDTYSRYSSKEHYYQSILQTFYTKEGSIEIPESDPKALFKDIGVKIYENRDNLDQKVITKYVPPYEFGMGIRRDEAHTLKNAGFWKNNQKSLGYNYDIKGVYEVLLGFHEWFLNELDDTGKIYKELAKIN